MTVYEVIILLAGLIFFVSSFFFGGKSAGEEVDMDAEIRRIKEAAVLHESEVKERLENLLAQECEAAVADVHDKLSKISNDKIIAVDEYAGQVLQKIENNNQSVVFLYDMLQKKEDEMKSTMNKMEQTRRENKALFDRLEELKQAKARAVAKQAKKAQGSEGAASSQAGKAEKPAAGRTTNRQADAVKNRKPAAAHSGKELEHTQAGALTEVFVPKDFVQEAEPAAVEDEQVLEEFSAETADRHEQVLALYRENKSVVEISKQLSMGQGEVKLIVDLYGKK